MKRLALVFLMAADVSVLAQSVVPPVGAAHTTPAAPPVRTTPPATASQTTIDRLAQTNQELLDLLKKQQAVLEDIQYDRRLQNRQIQLVEVRLEDTLQQNATLQAKVNELQAAAAAASAHPAAESVAPADKTSPPAPALSTPPPASYLPPPEPPGAPGVASWQRLFTLSGDDGKNSDMFHIEGKRWRVLWHNQDKPGETYKNTSALFISAFPKDDNIPKKVCSKLGSGGDSTELAGTGDYYLKVEASGGHWEAAVEDFR
jgi:TolA-binding protein